MLQLTENLSFMNLNIRTFADPHFYLCVVLVMLLLATEGIVQAEVIPTGDYSPNYDGSDPWEFSASLLVGTSSVGRLLITDSGFVDVFSDRLRFGEGNTEVGVDAGSIGTIDINQGGLVNDRNLIVGVNGQGTLTIENNSYVKHEQGFIGYEAESTASVIVNGEGSTFINRLFLTIAKSGFGTLDIEDGATVTNLRATIGAGSGSSGIVTVTGDESTWSNSTLFVGQYGNGTLAIKDGSLVSSSHGRLGDERFSTGKAIVSDTGSRWINTGDLLVGRVGEGSLQIENGGIVSNVNGSVSSGSSSTVIGVNSAWNNSQGLIVGKFGSGSLNIFDGGIVNVTNGTSVGTGNTSSPSVINFRNGTLNTGGLWAPSESLLGVGTINSTTFVGDEDLTFDSNDDSQNQLFYNQRPDQYIVINIEASNPLNAAPLGVGIHGSSKLRIADGRYIASGDGYLGYDADSFGEAVVSGRSSTWKNFETLFVGRFGNGELAVLGGASVVSATAYLGYGSGSNGNATVSGSDSNFSTNRLEVGTRGHGTLMIKDGATLNSGVSVRKCPNNC